MTLRVFARTTAEQKLRIVRAFKSRGHIVAMTGDGVNDAPALREAHIGVAMGQSGTDVARQAADLVLADDNFATIVEAVAQGRAIYRNIQKFIFFLLSSNMGLLVAVFVVSLIRHWPPLTPLMILWINLVTNGLPALALGIDPPDAHLMREPPRNPDEGLLGRRDYLGIVYVGAVMGALAVVLYAIDIQHDAGALLRTRAMAFSLLALSPLFHATSCRSPYRSILALRPLVSLPLLLAVLASAAIHLVAVLVPGLRPVFRTYALCGREWLLLLAMAALIVPMVELANSSTAAFTPKNQRSRLLPAAPQRIAPDEKAPIVLCRGARRTRREDSVVIRHRHVTQGTACDAETLSVTRSDRSVTSTELLLTAALVAPLLTVRPARAEGESLRADLVEARYDQARWHPKGMVEFFPARLHDQGQERQARFSKRERRSPTMQTVCSSRPRSWMTRCAAAAATALRSSSASRGVQRMPLSCTQGTPEGLRVRRRQAMAAPLPARR